MINQLMLLGFFKITDCLYENLQPKFQTPTNGENRILECTNRILDQYPNSAIAIIDLMDSEILRDGIFNKSKQHMIFSDAYTKLPDADYIEKLDKYVNFTIILVNDLEKFKSFYNSDIGQSIVNTEDGKMYYIIIQPKYMKIKLDRAININANGKAWTIRPANLMWYYKKILIGLNCSKIENIKYFYENSWEYCDNCMVSVDIDLYSPYGIENETGVDVLIINELVNKMNLSLVEYSTYSGDPYKYFNMAEQFYIGGIPRAVRKNNLASFPHKIDKAIAAVPLAQPQRNKYALANVFDNYMWVAVFSAFIVIVLTLHVTVKYSKTKHETLDFIFLQSYAVLFAQGVAMPSVRVLKILFIVWVFFSLIILNVYVGIYFVLLITPIFSSQIIDVFSQQFKDEIKSIIVSYKVNIMFDALIADSYKHLNTTFLYPDNPDIDHILDIIYERNVALFMNEAPAIDFNTQLINYGLDTFYIIPLGMQLMSIDIRNGRLNPFLNDLIHQLQANGLIEKWFRDYSVKLKRSLIAEPESLKILHFEFLFYIYFGGIVMAVVIFLYEWLYYQLDALM